MKTRSIRFKTSVLYSSILCVILACFSIYLFNTVRQILYGEAKQDLMLKAEQISGFLNAYGTISLSNHSPAYLMNQFLLVSGEGASDKEIVDQLWIQDSKSLGLRNDFFRILSSRGRIVLRSVNMTDEVEAAFNSQFSSSRTDTTYFTNLQLNGIAFYGINYTFQFSNRNAFILQLAAPLTSIQRILSKLVFFIMGGIAGILLITLFMGSFLTRRILKPVTDVTLAANNISQKNLNMRLPEQKLDHEMEQLVASFNHMIERLERAFTHVNDFSSHVAHELKTPLTIIKSELELALETENTKEENKRVMAVALQEINRLVKTIKDMLLLAKLEYKLNVFKMEEIVITEFLKDIYQHSKILAEEKSINLKLVTPDGPVLIKGDVVHIRRIFFNLIHNAVKFTPAGGEITILTEVRENKVFVSIKDTGIGIACADQPRIFEEFYRIRQADQKDISGNGLGLSISRAIARSHGGEITFVSEVNKGSIFTVILPTLPDKNTR